MDNPLSELRSSEIDGSLEVAEGREGDGNESLLGDETHSPVHQNAVPTAIRSRLYISHTLSTFNSRVFEFGAVLYLASIFPKTLLPLSVYAIFRSGLIIIFGPIIGRWIDQGERLKVVRASIIGGRFAVIFSCFIFWILVEKTMADDAFMKWIMLGALIVFACIEKICGTMNLVAVERDWVVIIAGPNGGALRNINASIRRIDLICKLGGPLVIAFLEGYSTKVAILVNLGLNVLSIPIEYYAIEKVYNLVRGLQVRKQGIDPAQSSLASPSLPQVNVNTPRICLENLTAMGRQIRKSSGIYFTHRAFLPSFSLALLYLTVLSFSGQMVTYLVSIGYESFQIGLARTVAVIFEVSATWLGPLVMAKIGPIRSGIWFVNWQILCLAGGLGLFWSSPDPIIASAGLVAGTILSRIGLWGFDMAVQIIVQEEVEPECRGAFSSMEASWQNAFEVCSYAATMAFSRPDQFGGPVVISGVAVCAAGACYTCFVRRRRGHLVHLSACVKSSKGRRDAPYHALPLGPDLDVFNRVQESDR